VVAAKHSSLKLKFKSAYKSSVIKDQPNANANGDLSLNNNLFWINRLFSLLFHTFTRAYKKTNFAKTNSENGMVFLGNICLSRREFAINNKNKYDGSCQKKDNFLMERLSI